MAPARGVVAEKFFLRDNSKWRSSVKAVAGAGRTAVPPPQGVGGDRVFLQSARTSELWFRARTYAMPRDRLRAEHPALAHIVCVLRVMLLLPVAACVLVAWIIATILAVAWVVLSVPFRRSGSTLLD